MDSAHLPTLAGSACARHGASRPATTSTPSSARRRRISPTSSAPACGSSSPELPADHDGAPLRRGEDGAARPARPRLVEGRRRAARAADAARLGRRSRARRRPTRRCRAAFVNVFVTGGSRGIGRAIALRFARDGAKRVAIGYLRNDNAAEATAEELRAPAPSRCSSAATSRSDARARARSRRSGRSTCSCTTPRPASSAPRSRPRTSTGTGR